MSFRKDPALLKSGTDYNPYALFRRMTHELDRMFDEPALFAWPTTLRPPELSEPIAWSPQVDVFKRDNRFVTRVDLPGMKKEDVKVEVTNGYLTISGERKRETEEKKDSFYRCEREYGAFYRAVPLPEGLKLDDIKAIFMDGVLEVSVPMAVNPEAKTKAVPIEEPAKVTVTAA